MRGRDLRGITGSGKTNAIIRPTKIEVSFVKIATNKVDSDLSMTQATEATSLPPLNAWNSMVFG